MSIDINIAKKETDLGFVFCGGAFLIVPLLHSNHIKYETPPQTNVCVCVTHDSGASFSKYESQKKKKKKRKQRVQIVLSVRLLYMNCMFLFTVFILSS